MAAVWSLTHVAAAQLVAIKATCARQLHAKCTILKLVTFPKGFARYTSGGDALFARGQPETVCGPTENPIFTSHSVIVDKRCEGVGQAKSV